MFLYGVLPDQVNILHLISWTKACVFVLVSKHSAVLSTSDPLQKPLTWTRHYTIKWVNSCVGVSSFIVDEWYYIIIKLLIGSLVMHASCFMALWSTGKNKRYHNSNDGDTTSEILLMFSPRAIRSSPAPTQYTMWSLRRAHYFATPYFTSNLWWTSHDC